MVDLETSLSQITTFKTFASGYLCRCPFAPKTHPKRTDRSPSLVIWEENCYFKCYSCGKHGTINDLFTELARIIPSPLHEKLASDWGESLWHIRSKLRDRPVPETIYLDEDILEHFPPVYGPGKDYLIRDRAIDERAILEYDIRYDERSKRVVFPVRDKTGLLGFVGRNIERKEHFKYFVESTKVLGGEDKFKHDRVAIVEGFMDLLKCWPWASDMGLDVGCCWTATLSETQVRKLANLDSYVYLMLDQDAAGSKGAEKFAKVYPGLSTRLAWGFTNDKGEVSDVGDMTEEQFRSFYV